MDSNGMAIDKTSDAAGMNSLQSDPVAMKRLASIDVYRGAVMFLMLAEMFHLMKLVDHFPDGMVGTVFGWLKFHTTHVEWVGCSLHDLIQPGFTFLVGVSLPFSLASRQRRQQNTSVMLMHALWRSILLICLGIFLRSLGREQTKFTFEDTLTQIGLGYFFLFLIGLAPRWVHYIAVIGVLIGTWGLFAASAPPPPDFDYAAVGVPADWKQHEVGFASRWNKNSNIAWQTDVWFLNLFPRESRFEFNRGGYATISAIPTLATMIFGLIAGYWLKEIDRLSAKVWRFSTAIVLCMALGWGIAELGYCPMVKRIWTPTFTLWSAGWCFLFLLGLHLLCDIAGRTKWAFPLLVIGSNSILIYFVNEAMRDSIHAAFERHLGGIGFFRGGSVLAELTFGVATFAVMWLLLLYLYRRKVFVRI